MSDHDYPRVAIVSSNPLRSDMANGIFARSLFAGWPKDRLAQVYFPVAATYPPQMDICHEYRMIRTCGLVRRYHGPDDQPSTEAGANAAVARGTWLGRLAFGLRGRRSVSRWLRLMQEVWYSYSWLGKVLERELDSLKPEIVYAALGNWCLTKITYTACRRLAIPMYIKAGDDFVTSLYQDLPFAPILQSLSDRWYRRAVSYADGMAAGTPVMMGEEFGRRYGKAWNWFATLIDADDYDPSPRPADEIIRLVYAGNLGLERWRSLRELALALKEYGDKRGAATRLEIYSSREQIETHRQALDVPPVTELRGWAAPEELPRIFHDADVLVHVESFDPAMMNRTRFSFSTKLSQYMMAGRCILMFGPHDISSTEAVRVADAGLTISSNDSATLQAALERLLGDASLRERYGHNGRRRALQWFEANAGRERFRLALVEALQQSRRKHAAHPAATVISTQLESP